LLKPFFTMMQKRPRSLANPAVGDLQYHECVRDFCKKEPLIVQLGSDLPSDLHRITPGSIVRAAPLLIALVVAGCQNGVIYPSKLETAVRRSLTESRHVPGGRSAELFANQVAEHVRLCFALLRTMMLEENDVSSGRRPRKAAAFRRACSASEHFVVKTITDKMVVTGEHAGSAEVIGNLRLFRTPGTRNDSCYPLATMATMTT